MIYTTIHKFVDVKMFFLESLLLKNVYYAQKGCIHLIKNTVKTVILWKNITFFCWMFSSHYSSLHCHTILQKSFYADLVLIFLITALSMFKAIVLLFFFF